MIQLLFSNRVSLLAFFFRENVFLPLTPSQRPHEQASQQAKTARARDGTHLCREGREALADPRGIHPVRARARRLGVPVAQEEPGEAVEPRGGAIALTEVGQLPPTRLRRARTFTPEVRKIVEREWFGLKMEPRMGKRSFFFFSEKRCLGGDGKVGKHGKKLAFPTTCISTELSTLSSPCRV